MAKIAFLGLGAMGSRMATRLLEAGHSLAVYNRTSSKAQPLRALGATEAPTPEATVQGADYIFSMVTDDQAARRLWLDGKMAAIQGIQPKQVVLECSTVTPSWVRELALNVERKNGLFVECPVAGSRPQAESGKLICFLGGNESVVEQVRPVLKPLAEAAHHVGNVGSASVFKLLVNGYFLSQIAALKEVMDVAKKSGLNTPQLNEIFQTLPATSPALKGILQLVSLGNTDPRFTVSLVEKDLRYLLEQAKVTNGLHGIFTLAYTYFSGALQEGHAEKNASVIVSP